MSWGVSHGLLLFVTLVSVTIRQSALVSALRTPASLVKSQHRNYVTVNGFELKAGSASVYLTQQGKSECHCRNLCLVDSACQGVSFNSSLVCSFTNLTAMGNNSFTVDSGSTFIFWPGRLIRSKTTTESDGLVYVMVEESLSWDAAAAACSAMPGFRLAVFTAVDQAPVAAALHKALDDSWFGLTKVDKLPKFTTGILLSDSALKNFTLSGSLGDLNKTCYYLKNEEVNDDECASKRKYICQSVFA